MDNLTLLLVLASLLLVILVWIYSLHIQMVKMHSLLKEIQQYHAFLAGHYRGTMDRDPKKNIHYLKDNYGGTD